MKKRDFIAIAAIIGMLSPALVRATPPAPGDLDAMTRNDVALLGFLDDAPLTVAEQQGVHDDLAAALAKRPDQLNQGAQQVALALDMLGRHNPQADALVRQTFRGAIEALPEDDTERRIVDAHDKTIAFNPQNLLIVSEHTLPVIATASRWAATSLDKPAPGGRLASDVRHSGVAIPQLRLRQ